VTAGVENVGDVMYDGMLHLPLEGQRAALAQAGVEPGRYVLATVHRAENTDDMRAARRDPRGALDARRFWAASCLALHPRTRARLIADAIEVPPGVHVIDPRPTWR
jgi:UDP-GlcNAc3NAcA epimerase